MPPKKPAKPAASKASKPKKARKPKPPAKERGRPTRYNPETYPDLAKRCCLLGATDEELAEFFDVHVDTIYAWKKKHPEFSEAVKAGKRIADMRIAEKLFNRAEGAVVQKQQAIKLKRIEYDPETGKKVSETEEIEVVDLVEELPPDTTAGIFWLKNRKAKSWGDKQQHEVSGPNGAPIRTETHVNMSADEAYTAMLNDEV